MRLHSPFRRLLPVLLAIGAGFATRPAHGGWSYSYVTNGNGTKIAEVAEQIFYTGNPTLGYDYEYQVANISPTRASINGFELYVGSQTNLVSQPLFPLGPVPSYRGYSLYFGGIPNASSTFLSGEGNTISPISWGFTEYLSDASGYRVTWGTAALPLPYHYYTEFDLFSPNSPVSGSGAVDPFSGPGGLGVDLTGSSSFLTTDFNASVPISSSQDTSSGFSGFSAYSSVPEPTSIVLFACGVLAMIIRVSFRTAGESNRTTRRAHRREELTPGLCGCSD